MTWGQLPFRWLGILLTGVIALALTRSGPGPSQTLAEPEAVPQPAGFARLSWLDVNPTPGRPARETMHNPAAVYCRDLGYTHETVTHPDGAQSGLCRFPDGTACDDWSFLAGMCETSRSACAQAGLATRTVRGGQNPYSLEHAVCVDATGAIVASVVELTDLVAKSSDGLTVPEPGIEAAGTAAYAPDGDLPPSFDWRDHDGGNWLTPVKNQGICGSCWAFTAVGVTEAILNIAADDPDLDRDLSEQTLVANCALDAGACDGGYKNRALDYIVAEGVPDEGCLPYTDGASSGCGYDALGACDIDRCTYSSDGECSDARCEDRCVDWADRLTTLPGYTYLGHDASINAIQRALISYGPLAASMGMTGSFSDGVYRCTDNDRTNHAVIIVGYDNSGGYWIVRNSWGSTWNGDGYFAVAYESCAIQKYVYHVVTCSTPPSVPIPITPSSDRANTDSGLVFDWEPVAGAASYRFQMDDDADFSSPLIDVVPAGSEVALPSTLSAGTYAWRVMACNACGCSAWSASQPISFSPPQYSVYIPLAVRP